MMTKTEAVEGSCWMLQLTTPTDSYIVEVLPRNTRGLHENPHEQSAIPIRVLSTSGHFAHGAVKVGNMFWLTMDMTYRHVEVARPA